jgi:hypothetical protein
MEVLRGALLAAILAAGQAPAAAGDQARDVLEDRSYQKDLPRTPPGSAGKQASQVLEDDGYQKRLPDPQPPRDPDVVPSRSFDLFRFLLYAAVAVAVLLALAWVVRLLVSGRERDVAVPAEAEVAPLEVELTRPERLAAAGRYSEAIHALLLETLAALSRASRLPTSFTSREILERVRLPARAREALGGLVLAVEISRFGGIPASEADYRICFGRFQEFLETCSGPGGEAAA